MRGLMMDRPLMISRLLQHAADYHAQTQVVYREHDGAIIRYSYREANARACRLAQAVIALGVKLGERVATLAWNTHRHFEMFYGVSGTGAVLHTVNPRLHHEQLVYIINHCEDKWLFCDHETISLVETLAPALTTVEGYVFMGTQAQMPASTSLPALQCYETLLQNQDGDYEWPEFDEYAASTICYTSGTTGNPKGVVYSHRGTVLSAMAFAAADFIPGYQHGALETAFGLAPMFHGNAWQFPYLGPLLGWKLVWPGRAYDAPSLIELLSTEHCTVMTGVPTFWLLLLEELEKTGIKLPSLRVSLSSGGTPPRWMVEKLKHEFSVELVNVWGMTEALGVSVGTLRPGDAELDDAEHTKRLLRSGRGHFLTDLRVIDDDGAVVAHDGVSKGHLQARGPWVSNGYFKGEGGDPLVDGGWLPTGDVAVFEPDGYFTIVDRSKDVIKSGGEWISSVEVENIAVGHAKIALAAVIGIAHPKWQERPLLVCVPQPGEQPTAMEILEFLRDKIAKWWMPDDVVFVAELPMTGTGKIQKQRLREQLKDYVLPDGRTTDTPLGN